MTATYLAGTALDRLGEAQAVIDAHVCTRYGICTGCGELAPCAARHRASAVFARYGALPRRRPGRTLDRRP